MADVHIIDFKVKYFKQLTNATRIITTDYPAELALQDYFVTKYVLNNDKELQKVNGQLEKDLTSCTVTATENGEYTIKILQPLSSPGVEGFYRIVQSCLLKAQTRVRFRAIKAADCEYLLDSLMNLQLSKRHLVYGEIIGDHSDRPSVFVAFNRHQEQSVDRAIKSTLDSLDSSSVAATRMKIVKIEEQLADITIGLGLEEGLKDQFPDIEIKLNAESDVSVIRLEGDETQLISAEKFIEQFQYDVVIEKSKIHIYDTTLLQTGKFIQCINDYIKHINLVCHLKIDFRRGDFIAAALNRETALKALQLVKQFIVERKISVPGKGPLHEAVESDNWDGLRRAMMKKHQYQVLIRLEDDVVYVTGVDRKVSEVVEYLDAISEQASGQTVGNEDNIQNEDTITRYLVDCDEVYMYLTRVILDKIFKKAKKIGVTVINLKDDNFQGFLVVGAAGNNAQMVNELDRIVEHIQTHNQEFDDDGYFDTSSGQDFVGKVGEKCNVLLDIMHKQPLNDHESAVVNKPSEDRRTGRASPAGMGTCVQAWTLQHRYRLELVMLKPEDTRAAVIVQYCHSSTTKLDYKWKQMANFTTVGLPVPQWKNEEVSCKLLEGRLSQLLMDAVTRSCRSVALPLDDIDLWPTTYFTKSVVSALLNACCHGNKVSGAANVGKLTLMLCFTNPEVIKTCQNVCDLELTGRADIDVVTDSKLISNGGQMLGKIGISVTKGELSETKADVLVNTTSPNLDLSSGAVSSSLLRSAGQNLQRELDKHYLDGLQRGEMAITKGHNLDCQYVLHGVLYPFKGQCQDEERFYKESVHNFVTLCLYKANKLRCQSIAFPAVGAGNLGYPVGLVAEEMFNAVNLFQTQHDETTLQEVVFVIYFRDDEAFEEYSKQKAEFDRNNRKDLSAGGSVTEERRSSACTIVRLLGFANRIEKATQHLEDKLDLKRTLSNSKGQGHTAQPSTSTDPDATDDDEDSSPGAVSAKKMHDHNNITNVTKSDIEPAETGPNKKATSEKLTSTSSKSYNGTRGDDNARSSYSISAIDWELVNHFHGHLIQKYVDAGVVFKHKNDKIVLENDVGRLGIFDVEFTSVISNLKNILREEMDIDMDMDMELAKKYSQDVTVPGKILCVFDADNSQVLFYSDCWNTIQKAKHSLKVKLGLLKPTMRGPRKFSSDKSTSDDENGFKQTGRTIQHGEPDVKATFKETGAVPKRKKTPSAPHMPVETFVTSENIKIKVYEADILNLNVDCIVNAANEKLKHGGGVAKVIAKASGKDLVKECDVFVRSCGKLQTGDVHTTSSGRLQYKYVIHAVGPRWADYRPYSSDLVDSCETDLFAAILNSLKEAEQLHMTSVAIPAVSSAVYGVPWQICTVQYASAILKYSRRRSLSSLLSEIHFIDINPVMVNHIQETFRVMIPGGTLPDFYMGRTFLKTVSGRPFSRREGDTKDRSNDSIKSDEKPPTAASAYTANTPRSATGRDNLYPCYSQTILRGRTDNILTCHLSDKQMLYVYQYDILDLKDIDVIVCSDDTTGSGKGIVAKKLVEIGGKKFEKAKTNSYKRSPVVGDVVLCEGTDTEFKWVIHAILYSKKDISNNEDRRHKHQAVFDNIFLKVKGLQPKVKSMAIPLLGTGTGKGKPEYSAEQFWRSYMHASQQNNDLSLTVHLVNIDLDKTQLAIRTIKAHIDSLQPVVKQTGHNKPLPSSTTTATTQDTHISARPRSAVASNSSVQSQHNKSSTAQRAGVHRNSARSSRKSDVTSQQRSGHMNASRDEHGFQKSQNADLQIPSTSSSYNNNKFKADNKADDGADDNADNNKANNKADDKADSLKAYGKADGGKADVKADDEADDCVICMDTVTNPKKLQCGHIFCSDCIAHQFTIKKVCPTCGALCGIVTGDQPDGDMDVTVSQHHHCASYESVGRIEILYSFFRGHQGPMHPDPGQPYRGITRMAFLPDNNEGRLICRMLKVAFDRRLVFTIGNSVTTGQQGVITWNDVHHKTDPSPHGTFGYPDPTYLDRVKDELAAKGVTEKDVT